MSAIAVVPSRITPPEHSISQRMSALTAANAVRLPRAELKREINRGNRDVLELINDPPREIHTMQVQDLLMCLPYWGRVKVSKVLHRAEISPNRSMAALTERQRGRLVFFVTAHTFHRS